MYQDKMRVDYITWLCMGVIVLVKQQEEWIVDELNG